MNFASLEERDMSTTATAVDSNRVNGLDVAALQEVVRAVSEDPARGIVGFRVKTAWRGQTRSETQVEGYTIGGQEVARKFTIAVDEPFELLGTNEAANPQEMLMAALNACIMVGYVAGAAVRGIALDSVEIETAGELDLRGFLGIDESVPPGYESIRYVVRIRGNGTREQFEELHQTVKKTSPNYFNISRPIRLDARLEVLPRH
jgi:uncharacterized OsmC-like protein